jgi:alkaline phosphatase
MGRYVEGFVIVVKKSKLNAYKKMAAAGGKIWMEHGALQYVECFGQDLKMPKDMAALGCLPFPKVMKSKPSENVVFSFIVYKSKAHRNAVMKKIMSDKRMGDMDPNDMPFKMSQTAYGGFNAIVDLTKKPKARKRKK